MKARYYTNDGSHYDHELSFDDEICCPNCGTRNIWKENGDGDYYEGPNHYCKKCQCKFTMPTFDNDPDWQFVEK